MSILNNRAEQRPVQRPGPRIITDPNNRFDYDMSKIPEGMSYKWLRITCMGQEDKEGMITAEMNGWSPVPAVRHPELAGPKPDKEATIIRGGLMLVEQPTEYMEESREKQDFQAKHVVESQIQRFGLAARSAAKTAGVGGSNVGIRRHEAGIPGDLIE